MRHAIGLGCHSDIGEMRVGAHEQEKAGGDGKPD
jgi:hypothetical protein